MGATNSNSINDFGWALRGALWRVAVRPSNRRIAPYDGSRISPPWQLERERRLLRLCRCIAARVARGQTISRSAKKLSRKWNARPYKSDPKRKISLAPSYLATIYRNWKRDGCGESFRLNYKGPTARKVPVEFILEVARRAQAHGVYSLQSVLRGIYLDLKRGKQIPGLGKFSRKNIPATLPFARTAHRHFAGIDLSLRRALAANIAEAMAQLSEIDRAIALRAKAATAQKRGTR